MKAIVLIIPVGLAILATSLTPGAVWADEAGNGTNGSTGTGPSFSQRFETPTRVPSDKALPPQAKGKMCFPANEKMPKTYGFYTLNDADGNVEFGTFSRVQYYSLTPSWDGNIEPPQNWNTELTKNAHKHGSSVDLVISNDKWFFEGGFSGFEGYDYNGLWLTKSYVLLTLIEDIVTLVTDYNFDGITLDFRLPNDHRVIDSYVFFVNRLKIRLDNETNKIKDNTLLVRNSTKLNLIIDTTFVERLTESKIIRDLQNEIRKNLPEGSSRNTFNDLMITNAEYVKIINSPTLTNLDKIIQNLAPSEKTEVKIIIRKYTLNNQSMEARVAALKVLFNQLSDSVDLLFVDTYDQENESSSLRINETVGDGLKASNNNLMMVYTYNNEQQSNEPVPFTTTEFGKRTWLWDISGAGKLWQESPNGLHSHVFGDGFDLLDKNSELVCTNRNLISVILVGVSPLLALLVLVSWIYYDFPLGLRHPIGRIVIWSLLGVSIISFTLLMLGLPSHNWKNPKIYIILISFSVPLIYLVWAQSSKSVMKKLP